MDLAARINHDLIAGSDAQTRVVVGAKVHHTLARGRVRLFIESAGDGETTSNARLNARHRLDVRRVDIHCRGLRARGDIGTCRGRDAVLDVGARDRIRLEWLDVEYDGDNI